MNALRIPANENGEGACPMDAAPLVLSPADPLPSARAIVAARYTSGGRRTIHAHSSQFYVWTGTHYTVLDDAAVRATAYGFLEKAMRRGPKEGMLLPFQPTSTKVSNVLDALRAVANIPATTKLPAWLEEADYQPPAVEILACKNGLLHLPTRRLVPPTPVFFSTNAVDFEYQPKAPPPTQWLSFLASVWPDDQQAIATLQEMFGYLLLLDTRQQKIFLVVGPKRSGKGTVARILTAMLGQDNVCSPTLASLGQNFGLAPLIAKQAAIIADARLGGHADQAAIAERLLSISGEDSLTVDRKFMPGWTGRLTTRFLVLTNELPRLADVSGALASRFVVLTMKQSFYGREDIGLTDRLLKELPSILNWAIEGWQRLARRGYFVQPASSAEAIEELETLSSPITAFIRERCILAPGRQVGVQHLYKAWANWCEENGRAQPGTAQSFGRDIKTACPGITVRQRRDIDTVVRLYEGIGLP